jgi:FkbM family methyltransferase
MKITAKIKSVTSDPAMLSAYACWVGAKVFFGRPPRLSLTGGTRLGGWVSFSEYWSFLTIFSNIRLKPERVFIERCLAKKPAGATAFDIGANVGVFTCLIAGMGSHNVHAFEAIPETFCRLTRNVKLNGLLDRSHLNCVAVGRGRDLVTFHVQERSPDTNHMAIHAEKQSGKAISSQLVAVIDLDGYCQSQNVEFIDFLKIDVEGMEPYVMQGASALLRERKIAAILIEICPTNLRNVGLSPGDLYREFDTARYLPYALNDDGKPGEKLSLAQIEAMSLANVVLLPNA